MANIDNYLAKLAGCLHGPRRARARLVAETEEHLRDAIDHGIAAGEYPRDAEAAALQSFGDPEAIAAEWNRDRRLRRRRTQWIAAAAAAIVVIVGAVAFGVAQLVGGGGHASVATQPHVGHRARVVHALLVHQRELVRVIMNPQCRAVILVLPMTAAHAQLPQPSPPHGQRRC
jgi:hypothetical protein